MYKYKDRDRERNREKLRLQGLKAWTFLHMPMGEKVKEVPLRESVCMFDMINPSEWRERLA